MGEKYCWHLSSMQASTPGEAIRDDLCCWCGELRRRLLVTKPVKNGTHGEALTFPIARRVVRFSVEPFECIRQGSLFESLSKKGASS